MQRKRKLPEDVIVEITGLAHDGRGIARINEKILFVFGALPGEKVQAQYTRRFSRFDEGKAVAILSMAPERIAPACPHFSVCGGCQLQHLQPASQIEYKQRFLAEQLAHKGIQPANWFAPLRAATERYRQKARLGVRYVKQKDTVVVGFREQNNNKISIIESCAILDQRVGARIKALRQLISNLDAKEDIAQIEMAATEQEVALVFRNLQPLSPEDQSKLIHFGRANELSIYLQGGGVDTVQKIWPDDSSLWLTYELPSQQLNFNFHPLDFTQVNAQINQAMINQALALLDPQADDEILDLFCGLGNFSLPFAQRARFVVGVEGSSDAVARAKHNANLNHLVNTDFHVRNLAEDFTTASWAAKSYNKIILDPPRSGAEMVVNHITQFGAQDILYVSCNPATFVRDAEILIKQHGYRLEHVGVMDMFPHTAHVETMGLFTKARKS